MITRLIGKILFIVFFVANFATYNAMADHYPYTWHNNEERECFQLFKSNFKKYNIHNISACNINSKGERIYAIEYSTPDAAKGIKQCAISAKFVRLVSIFEGWQC